MCVETLAQRKGFMRRLSASVVVWILELSITILSSFLEEGILTRIQNEALKVKVSVGIFSNSEKDVLLSGRREMNTVTE